MLLSFVSPLVENGVTALPLHAPDGFFSLPVAAVGWIISVAFIAYAVRRTGKDLNERLVPMMGIMGAFVFAAQMINFPVPGGTSGHLVGGALAAVVLGPWAAILVMTAVVSLQALLFQDGGLVALGINLLNMAIMSPLLGYAVWQVFRRFGPSAKRLMLGGFAAGWVSVMIAAVAVAFQLSFSGTSPLVVALPALAIVHVLIGIGEGLITVGALSFIRAARPNLLPMYPMRQTRTVEANQA